eukprot:TRINITY_DN45545_c0_g1_i1.p1 TRINITY_DN45545_c0_g1~~TRINITY_DN45545_c0_g1_i1.p1  ORF type:complete len:510 (+),score=89.89 TRINITY_DN45545_c0_g1_i1:42-1571(+)
MTSQREGRALTQEMVFMRTKCNRMDLIKNLNLWGNDLQDISVIRAMPNLEVLSLSVNQVSTLKDLRYCPKLAELYLRKNDIFDISEILHLRSLTQMKVIWLSDNPCATLPFYRQYVLHHLPGLTKIDAQDVTEDERRQARKVNFEGVQTSAGDFSPVTEETPRRGQQAQDEAAESDNDSLRGVGMTAQHQPGLSRRFSSDQPALASRRHEVRRDAEMGLRRARTSSFQDQDDDLEGEHRRQLQQHVQQAQQLHQQAERVQRQPSYMEDEDSGNQGRFFSAGLQQRQGTADEDRQLQARRSSQEDTLDNRRPMTQGRMSRPSAWDAQTPPRTANGSESPQVQTFSSSTGGQYQRRSAEASPESGRASPGIDGPEGVWAAKSHPAAFGNQMRRSSEDIPASAALRRSLVEKGAGLSAGEARRPSGAEAWAEHYVDGGDDFEHCGRNDTFSRPEESEKKPTCLENEADMLAAEAGRPRADNILCAVLALIKELDDQGLGLVRRAVDQRLSES